MSRFCLMKHNIILVGDNRLFLEGLSLILESGDLTVVRTCDRSSDLISILADNDFNASVVIWDSSSVADHEIDYWAAIRHDFPRIGIVVLAQHIDDRRVT